ncbi:hypothetical protein BN949_05109 [Agrobacterium tumefaciens]|nr:hypothetical protein BN949_05109 [Agrobacterium tumefaciens]
MTLCSLNFTGIDITSTSLPFTKVAKVLPAGHARFLPEPISWQANLHKTSASGAPNLGHARRA